MSKAWRTLLKNVVQNKQPTGQRYFKFHFPLSISSRVLLNLGTNTHLTPMSSGAALGQIVLPCKQTTQLFCFLEHLESQPTHQQTRQFKQHYAIGMHCTASISTAPTFVIPPKFWQCYFNITQTSRFLLVCKSWEIIPSFEILGRFR